MSYFISFLSKKFLKLAEEVPSFNARFKSVLSKFINTNISDEDLNEWFKINDLDIVLDYYDNNIEAIHVYTNNNEHAIITKPNYQFNVDISFEKLLLPYKNIPKLIFIIGDVLTKILPKNVAENYFIYTALGQLFGMTEETASVVIENNKEKINNIRKFFKFTPKYLGQGIDGVAFKINDSMVLKLFTSNYSYEAIQKTEKLLFHNKDLAENEIMVYDYGKLKLPNDKNLYYYIIQLVKTFPDYSTNNEKIQIIISKIKDNIFNTHYYSLITLNHKYASNLIEDSELKEKIDSLSGIIYEQIQNDIIKDSVYRLESTNDLQNDWLIKLIQEILFKLISGRRDLHSGNIGITNNGYFRYFDPAYLQWQP